MKWPLVAKIDNLGHKLHLPEMIQKRLCHWLDKSVGLYDTDDVYSFYGD